MSKKETILKVFNDHEWLPSPSGEMVKIIEGSEFSDACLWGNLEFGYKYCDMRYASRIIQSMGHRVLFGHAMYIYKDKLKKPNS